MTSFSLECPTAIHFGTGSIVRLEALARAHGRRVFFVTGERSFDASPRLSGLTGRFSGCDVERWTCPPGEPSEQSVDDAAAAAARFRPDVIVGVGGGSVLDTAKALSALVRDPGPCRRFLEGMEGSVPIASRGVPWIAVPTTAGTGAEATKNAVIRSDTAGAKRSMRSAYLLADAVVVDPELTVTLPPGVTGASGLDALTQLVEAYVSRGANPLVASLIEGAFPLMMAALEGLPRAPGDVELRSRASYGALVSGIALANAGLGAAHGFAAAVGSFHVPHGLACAVFLPPVLKANASVIREKLARLAGTCVGTAGAGDAVEWLSAKVAGSLSAFGLPSTLRGFAIPRSRIGELAEKSMGSSMRGNPRELGTHERVAILDAVI